MQKVDIRGVPLFTLLALFGVTFGGHFKWEMTSGGGVPEKGSKSGPRGQNVTLLSTLFAPKMT